MKRNPFIEPQKISFEGIITSIEPRATVWRYRMDNRTHREIGYNLFLNGIYAEIKNDFVLAITEAMQNKYRFRINDRISGNAWKKLHEEREFADFYKVSNIKILARCEQETRSGPPWTGEAPDLEVYSNRGARMLSTKRWKSKCRGCRWANMSNVTIEYNFNTGAKKYRFESFCYGPLDCPFYAMGPARSVPYYKKESSSDTGWMDDMCVEMRSIYFKEDYE